MHLNCCCVGARDLSLWSTKMFNVASEWSFLKVSMCAQPRCCVDVSPPFVYLSTIAENQRRKTRPNHAEFQIANPPQIDKHDKASHQPHRPSTQPPPFPMFLAHLYVYYIAHQQQTTIHPYVRTTAAAANPLCCCWYIIACCGGGRYLPFNVFVPSRSHPMTTAGSVVGLREWQSERQRKQRRLGEGESRTAKVMTMMMMMMVDDDAIGSRRIRSLAVRPSVVCLCLCFTAGLEADEW